MLKNKIIAVDFDGTLCENKWPDIGESNNEVLNYIKNEKKNGAKIILWTCRTGELLTNAINWCLDRNLLFDAINRNVKNAIEEFGEDTRKVFANEYIDDKSNSKFKLPFTKREMGITDEVLKTLEHVVGFNLYDWQKRYLKGDNTAWPQGGRRNGKTFAYCARLLLEDPWNRPSFDLSNLSEIKNLVDEDHGPHYRNFFQGYLRNLNNHLVANGFRTNAKKPVSCALSDEDLKSIETAEEKRLYLCDRKACLDHCNPECKHTEDIRHAKNFERFVDGTTFIENSKPLVILQCDTIIKQETMDRIRKKIMTEIEDNVLMAPAYMKALTIDTEDNRTLIFDVQLVKRGKLND